MSYFQWRSEKKMLIHEMKMTFDLFNMAETNCGFIANDNSFINVLLLLDDGFIHL